MEYSLVCYLNNGSPWIWYFLMLTILIIWDWQTNKVPATWSAPLSSGGPSTAIWTWFSGSIFSLCIALSSTFIHYTVKGYEIHSNWRVSTQLLSSYLHILRLGEYTSSQSMYFHPRVFRWQLGLLGGQIFWDSELSKSFVKCKPKCLPINRTAGVGKLKSLKRTSIEVTHKLVVASVGYSVAQMVSITSFLSKTWRVYILI